MAGTIQRDKIYVYDTCAECSEKEVLVYDADSKLLCAYCYRTWTRKQTRTTTCDRCGNTAKVFRNPKHRRNEYMCLACHIDDGFYPEDSATYRAFKQTATKELGS